MLSRTTEAVKPAADEPLPAADELNAPQPEPAVERAPEQPAIDATMDGPAEEAENGEADMGMQHEAEPPEMLSQPLPPPPQCQPKPLTTPAEQLVA